MASSEEPLQKRRVVVVAQVLHVVVVDSKFEVIRWPAKASQKLESRELDPAPIDPSYPKKHTLNNITRGKNAQTPDAILSSVRR